MSEREIGIFIIFGGIALFAVVITTLDWWARRRQRREHTGG